LVAAELVDGVGHGEDVFEGGFFEDGVVAGAGDVASAGHHDIEDVAGLLSDVVGVAFDEDVLGVDGSVEEDLSAEACFELGEVHAVAGWLDGVEGVEARIDHRGDEWGEAAAAVEHDFEVEGVAQVDKLLEVGQEEAAKEFFAEERASGAAEVVADEEDVDGIGGGFEGAFADGEVVVENVFENGVDEFGLVVHFEVHIFHAEQIDEVVPEGGPFAAEDGEAAVVA